MKRGQVETVIFILIGLIAAGGALYAVKGPSAMPKVGPGRAIEQPLSCTGLEMVWTTGRRDPYQYAGDACAGYRCLKGSEISPACYNAQECPAACSETCVSIPAMQQICSPTQQCFDSDNGQDPFVRGKAVGPEYGPGGNAGPLGVIWGEDANKCSARVDTSMGFVAFYDCCSDVSQNKQLNEAYCDGKTVMSTGIICENGCKDGACIQPPTQQLTCSDSDGDNYYNYGHIKEFVNGEWITTLDTCVNADRAEERVCVNGHGANAYFDCTFGCKNGACVPPSDCTDSDGGKNLQIKGKTCAKGSCEEDRCSDDAAQVLENYCEPSQDRTGIFYPCPNGCVNGACMGPGDIFVIEDLPTNPLNVDEPLGAVVETVVDDMWLFLKDGQIGPTKYHEYLRLGGTDVPSGKVIFGQNELDQQGSFLFFKDGNVMFEFDIEFEEGFDSAIVNNHLVDLEGKTIPIFKLAYTITAATVDSSTGNLKMQLHGPQQIVLVDSNFADTLFAQAGVEINNELIEDAEVRFQGALLSPTSFELSSIRYRLKADAKLGDVYVPAGGSLRQQLDEPQGMLGNWDIFFDGVKDNIAKVYLGPAKQPPLACVDSDGGIDIFTAGQAATPGGGFVDSCDFLANVNGIMNEAVCDADGNPTFKPTRCPDSAPYCRDAVCTTDNSPACKDTDGENVFTQGTISERRYVDGPKHTDYCQNLQTLQPSDPCEGPSCGIREFTCQEPYVTTTFKDVQCSNGCMNGACLTENVFTWHNIPKNYYDPSTFVENPLGIQAKYVSTCNTVCKDLGLVAQPKCIGWGPNYCRKTGTPQELMSAGQSCDETGFTGIIGLDYCCCGPAASCKCGVNTFKLETPCDGVSFESGARFAYWECHDGKNMKSGSMNVCKSSAEWQSEAKQLCEGSCTAGCPAISGMWLKTDKLEYKITDEVKVYTHLPTFMDCKYYFVPAGGEPILFGAGGCLADGYTYSGPVQFAGEWKAQIVAWYPESPQDTFVVTSPSFKVLSTTCTDTDGGVNYDTKGTVTYPDGGKNSDLCIDEDGMTVSSGPTVVEYSCPLGKEVFKCPDGCKDGECRKPAAKNCGELFRNPSTSVFFPQCKTAGYENVCFNKYSGEYQGCTKDSWNDCTQNNVNSASNLLCRASAPGGCEVFYDPSIGAEKKDLDYMVPDCARMAGGSLNCQTCDTKAVSGRKRHYTREIVNKPKCGTFTPRPAAQAIECPSRKVCKYTTIQGKKVGYCG